MHKSQKSLKQFNLPKQLQYISSSSTNTTLPKHRECILFPTYAKRDPQDPSKWIIRVKGWALTLKTTGPKQKVLKGITKSIAGKKSINELSNRMFEHRFKYFLANGKRNRYFYIEAIHTTGPNTTTTTTNNNNNNNNTTNYKRRIHHTTPTIWDKSYEYPPLEAIDTRPIIFNSTYSSTTSSLNNTSTEEEDDNDYTPPPTPTSKTTTITTKAKAIKATTTTTTTKAKAKTTKTTTPPATAETTSPMITPQTAKSTPTTAKTTNKGVTLISETTGVFSGELHVSHNQILKWNSESRHERMIKIKSLDLSKKETTLPSNFPTSYGQVNLIEPTGVSIISDIDDTIKYTKVLAGARTVLTNTFFNPTRAVPGMADTYSQWYNLGASFHYVSNSPFQLTHMLNSFMTNHHFPPGSFHLRESTGLLSKLGASKKPGRSKHDSICGIMRDFPQKKFILIGDSGEIDLEIYTRVATEFPGQVIKIFIRDVTSSAQLNQPAKKKRYHPTTPGKSASFPLFFSSNHHTSKSSPPSTDDDDDYVDLSDNTASKIAELVLEPTLTGHSPVVSAPSSNHIHDLVDLVTAPASPPPPPSHNFMQLQNRLSSARGLLKNTEIVLFKDAKELCSDERVQHALHNCT